MKEEVIKIEELNSIDLIKLIYQEIKNTQKKLNEKIDNIYYELNPKIHENFKYLDEKINDTKNALVIEISEELKEISITTKLMNDLEKKINNEINDRKLDVSKVKDFNKIILSDIGSRVSILEEESEKYNLN